MALRSIIHTELRLLLFCQALLALFQSDHAPLPDKTLLFRLFEGKLIDFDKISEKGRKRVKIRPFSANLGSSLAFDASFGFVIKRTLDLKRSKST